VSGTGVEEFAVGGERELDGAPDVELLDLPLPGQAHTLA
jgi:hypothetical protein